ncbi:hypothetical protein H7F50_09390 [Novosphingobium flavum]|uniref:DUF5672 family protein n=1 Tax=Novosphingobium aerophilum TaxID=2839843 RepID=UPI0016398949|nr:DUF5672 family protein [Novosphingobium aerophilum]MBC2661974.1 hypothetical protein [Novosphingobium aerophilum]
MSVALLSDGRLALPTVTLVAVTSAAVAATARAMAESLRHVAFGEACWCSDSPPPGDIAGQVRWVPIERIASRQDYSAFLLRDLAHHIATEHVLVVQWDGFVLNPLAWDDAFLNCDYLGAPWAHFADGYDVGNGGFSLRSRRLLEATGQFPHSGEAEDVAICRTWRHRLEQEHGLVFGSTELARRFAFERTVVPHPTFGFHGVFNMPQLVGRATFRDMMRTIEPVLMAPNEMRDMFWWALRRLDFVLAWLIVRRRLARWRSVRPRAQNAQL